MIFFQICTSEGERKGIEHVNWVTKNKTNVVSINRFSDLVSSKKFGVRVLVREKWKGCYLESGMHKTEVSILVQFLVMTKITGEAV